MVFHFIQVDKFGYRDVVKRTVELYTGAVMGILLQFPAGFPKGEGMNSSHSIVGMLR